jgi:hypothetical protein
MVVHCGILGWFWKVEETHATDILRMTGTMVDVLSSTNHDAKDLLHHRHTNRETTGYAMIL